MSVDRRTPSDRAVHRICGPGDLLQAVPYLLGFHPRRSLVLVGLDGPTLVVTARLDLPVDGHDPEPFPDVVADTLGALVRGGTTEVLAAVFDDPADDPVTPGPVFAPDRLSRPWWPLAELVLDAAEPWDCRVLDVLLVRGGRWWSLLCDDDRCCPRTGTALPTVPSPFATAATVSGVVALPDRAALESLLDPVPDSEREALAPAIAAAEDAAVEAVLHGAVKRHVRSAVRAVFAAARASDEPGWAGPDTDLSRLGVALSGIAVRDPVWMGVDDGRLDGRSLWRELARRLPAPYDAAPLFLFGWASWRAGDGALAGIAAERAVASDPGYSAADLLLAALARGVDPRQLPRLRLRRPA